MRKVNVIPSKSAAHRALICAALSGKPCRIRPEPEGKDVAATIACLDALTKGQQDMNCGESGSTLRFLLPVAAALGQTSSFHMEGRLPERPLSPLYEELESHGCTLSPKGSNPMTILGKLQPGDFHLPGNVSSQYISGLIFALPILEGRSRIIIDGKLESRGYVDMTLATVSDFGIEIEENENGWIIPGGQRYLPRESYTIEGDWSNGCFWLAAGALIEEGIEVTGLSTSSLQGDRAIMEILRDFGADIRGGPDGGIAVSGGSLKALEIDGSQIPDMVPILAVLACRAEGTTTIKNAGRLRIKESDRLETVSSVLAGLGADITELADGLVIKGKGRLAGGKADSHNDHRIAMMSAIASLICDDKVLISGSEAVAKSYPSFFERLEELGLADNVERI